jgi:ferric-dicitrate binding protein FerR (iron transport regulator)
MDITPDEIAEQVLGTANEWFARLNAAEHIEDEWLDFERWMDAAPFHGLAFRALEETRWALVDLGLVDGPPTD